MKKFILISIIGFSALTAAAQEKSINWVKVADSTEWKARDSQGEVVFKNKLWILGGWYNSYDAPPRDVWNSSDGKQWNLITPSAPWIHSDLPMSIAFKGKIWMMGGWYKGRLEGHSASNQVWASNDGLNWKQVTEKAAWTPRIASAIVEFKGKMWLLGGTENYYFGNKESLKNDVWYSSDGKTWELATANAGWSPRAYHQAAVLNGKIYVFGGGNYVPEYFAVNDVWSSEDGVSWTQVTPAAPWHSRIWFSSVVYRDRIWIMGGWSNNPYTNWPDVWYTEDGKNWEQLKSNVSWKERHEHSAFVFKDKIWVAGGMNPPLVNDVWTLEIPKKWFDDKE